MIGLVISQLKPWSHRVQEKFERLKFQEWDYLYLKRDENKPTVFILHGYGANANDLAGLASYLDQQAHYNWVFPEAPIQLPYMGNARAWFPIDEQALQKAMMTGIPRDFQSQKVENLDDKIDGLADFIKSFQSEEILIGGFSQGGMMSLHIHHKFEAKLKGLLLMSTALVDEAHFKGLSHPNFPTLMTHGKQDPVVGYREGAYALKTLQDLGYQAEMFSFEGAHEISMGALDKIKYFLSQSCS